MFIRELTHMREVVGSTPTRSSITQCLQPFGPCNYPSSLFRDFLENGENWKILYNFSILITVEVCSIYRTVGPRMTTLTYMDGSLINCSIYVLIRLMYFHLALPNRF